MPIDVEKWRREMLAKRRERGLCLAKIYHGPGHQSTTFCERETHEDGLHRANAAGRILEWETAEGMTGFFDENPEVD